MNKNTIANTKAKQLRLSHGTLTGILAYDPESGVFTNKINRRNAPIGIESGSANSSGYRRVMIDRTEYSAHRLAWFYVHKKWPGEEIDHINRIKNDNRICNLREATHSINMLNREKRAKKSSGVEGIWWRKSRNSWEVMFKNKRIGCRKMLSDAISLREEFITRP